MTLPRLLVLISFGSAGWALDPDWQKPILKTSAIAPTDAQALDLLKAVCVGNMASKKASDGLPAVACQRVCPSYTDFPGDNIGMDAVAVTFGHFRSPNSDDAVVSTEGCESHASVRGGSYLATQTGGKWRILWY